MQNITYVVLLEFNTEKVKVLTLRKLEQFIKKKATNLHYQTFALISRIDLPPAGVTCLSHGENKLHQVTEKT